MNFYAVKTFGIILCVWLIYRFSLGDPQTVARQASLSMVCVPGKNTEWVAISVSMVIFPTQGLNPGLLHCQQILCHLSYEASTFYIVRFVLFWFQSKFFL